MGWKHVYGPYVDRDFNSPLYDSVLDESLCRINPKAAPAAFADFTTFFEGIFQKERLLDIIKNFICFNNDGVNSYKILAGYHQYFGVRTAVERTKIEDL